LATDTKTKPWGWEEIWALTDKYCGKFLHVRNGESLSWQFHAVKDETIHLLSGTMLLDLSDTDIPTESVLFLSGQSCHIPPGKRHRVTALETSIIVEVSTPELDDVVRLEDKYGRHANR
jgi:mannose-6-phosphate isomerase-like protein (cupin superfamily)